MIILIARVSNQKVIIQFVTVSSHIQLGRMISATNILHYNILCKSQMRSRDQILCALNHKAKTASCLIVNLVR